jgi:hypothetical protein
MERHRVYRQFDDDTVRFTYEPLDDLGTHIFQRYQDERCRQQDGVKRCWITDANGQLVLGRPPANWAPEN